MRRDSRCRAAPGRGGLAQTELRELEGLVGRAGLQEPQCAFTSGGDHVVELTGTAGVMRDRGEVVAVAVAQRVERRVMQAPAFTPEEVGLDRLACERVPEREDVGLRFDQQAAVDEVAQDRDELALGVFRDGGKDVEVDARHAENRGGLEHGALLGGEVVELPADQLRKAPRQLLAEQLFGIVLACRREELLEEVRIAAGAGV